MPFVNQEPRKHFPTFFLTFVTKSVSTVDTFLGVTGKNSQISPHRFLLNSDLKYTINSDLLPLVDLRMKAWQ